MVGCSVRICLVKAPSGLSFRVGSHNGSCEEGFEMLDVSDEVGSMGEWAEEACGG